MIWNKMKKKPRITTTKIGEFGKFGLMLDAMRKFVYDQPRTSKPQGKVGVVEQKGLLEFGPRFRFRKFEKKPFDNAAGFIKALQKRGFEVLGTGAFSTVLAKPGQKRVIKVIRRPDGWINYIHWAAQIGEAGHFAPKVYSYKKIKGRQSEFAVAVMERLEYDLDKTPEEHALKIVPGLLWRVDKNEMARKFVEVLAPGLAAYMEKMAAKWNVPIQSFDLHSGNLMVRADGSFVVVDPVSRGEEGYVRLRAGDFSPAVALRLLRIFYEGLYHYPSRRHSVGSSSLS